MESFLDVQGNHPVTQIQVARGETKVVRLKKFDVGQPVADHPGLFSKPAVVVFCQNPSVAFCDQVSKLAETKTALNNRANANQINTNIVESGGFYFFQICGKAAGTTELAASFMNQPQGSAQYASSVRIVVTENKKRLFFNTSIPFNMLWNKHPLFNPAGPTPDPEDKRSNDWERRSLPCPRPELGHNQCMVRLCTALTDAGIDLTGLDRLTNRKCFGKGARHKAHFSWPPDFALWKPNDCYQWNATQNQPEPMPGLAAWKFMLSRVGIVLFKNYFPLTLPGGSLEKSVSGGHIDLWNETRMGNNFSVGATEALNGEGLSAFLRSQSISFWPLD